MFSKIFNYAVRLIMLSLGAFMVVYGVVWGDSLNDPTLVIVFGVVVVFFSIYRLAMYRIQSQRYQFDYSGDSEDEEDSEKEK